MWDVLVRAPRGSNSPRKLSMLLASFMAICFGYIFLNSTPVSAIDASWTGDNITYEGNTFAPVAQDATLPVDIPQSATTYQYTDTSNTPNIAHFIYFTESVANPKSSKEATYIRYTLNPPNTYADPTAETKISLTPSEPDTADTSEGTFSNCTIEGIGYIVCPLMKGIAEGMDFIYERIRGFLEVQPLSFSNDNPIYRVWVYSRDLANIAFIIGFLVIIYSYLVGGGFSGYEVRKIIPRIILAAVLINISYVVCAVAVDVSNIAGYGVNQLFENVRDTVLPGSAATGSINWTSTTTWILAGGTGAIAGGIALNGSVAGAAGGLWFLLAPFLLGAALLVMVTFLILAARQAIIVLAIAIAPLAFAAYILPNTEKYFEKWRSLFFTMLIMFPAFGAVFGGAQLAGEVIIRTAAANGSIEQIILGLGVMVAPLAITPLLLKLGGGVLNRFGGIINNPQKGLYDRYKNYNRERLDDHKAKNDRINSGLRETNGFGRRQFMRRRSAYDYAKKNYRENQRKSNEEGAQNNWQRQTGRWGYSNTDGYGNIRSRITRRQQDGYGNLDTFKRDNQLYHDQTEANHEEHWQNNVQNSPVRRAMLTDTRMSEGRGKIISGAMEAQDDRTFQTALNTSAAYTGLRAQKVQTSVDSGVADIQKAAVEAAGKLALSSTVNTDRALANMKINTFSVEKQAETIDNTIQKQAEQNWNTVSRTNAAIQNLRLSEVQAGDQAKKAEEQWNTILENITAVGSAAPGVIAAGAVADSIKDLREDIQLESYKQDSAKRVTQSNMSTLLKESEPKRILAGGIGGEEAANRIYAKARDDIVKAAMADITASRSVLSEYSLNELINLHQNHKTRDNQPAPNSMVDAAMQEILLSKGNNWAFQKTKDYIAGRGMHYDEGTNKYYNDAAKTQEITDQDEIDRRRDEQQLFVDSAKNSKLSIKSLSGTDRGDLETGTFTLNSTTAITRDIRDQKINAERLAGTDIDELMRMVQVLRDDSVRGKLTEEQRKSMVEQIEFATDKNNPQISGRIAQREKEMLGVISKYLSNGDPMTNDEKWAIEGATQTPIPTRFDSDKPYGPSAAFSTAPNKEPYGPDGRTDLLR